MATAIEAFNYDGTFENHLVGSASEVPASGQVTFQSEPVNVKINNLTINGFINPETGVANFLNIPYARIPARFSEASLIDPRKEVGVIDALKFGPCCPQPLDRIHDLTGHLYPQVFKASNQAEFTCLSINLYAPPTALISAEKLPVFVWIHGGAFTYGDASNEYDGNYMVQHSMAIRKPIIVASMNYRVGPYGFLTSKELKEEAIRRGEHGYANQGFHDQRLGLQWIQRNIHWFGGNGWEVTAAGESAGACSLLTHIRSDFPAFQRAFVLSAASLRPQPFSATQKRFDALVSRSGISASALAEDKLAALRSLTAKELNIVNGGGVSPPTWDPEVYVDGDSESWLEDGRTFPSWLKGMVVGSTKEEAALFLLEGVRGTDAVSLVKSCYRDADSDFIHEILRAYKIEENDAANSGTDGLVCLLTHGMFTHAAHSLASHAEIPVSLYSFDQVDPFRSSRWKGRAYHSLGNSMLFRQPTVAGPGADMGTRATSNRFCEAAITLTHGEQPWEAYTNGHRMMVLDGKKSGLVQADDRALWSGLTRTKERLDAFKTGGMTLIREAIEKANRS